LLATKFALFFLLENLKRLIFEALGFILDYLTISIVDYYDSFIKSLKVFLFLFWLWLYWNLL